MFFGFFQLVGVLLFGFFNLICFVWGLFILFLISEQEKSFR